ncbi:GNAT family N-acetyltransferase [Pseudoalteromonas fenneropenaei]|uniref:GNAT family N-acetyltransferase n=1 Tax=Pseudoalteromonas fenneropenaei TaxID=1737459 RepID=A0ABV7CFG8_9GAMM
MHLTTPRLTLRLVRHSDARALTAILNQTSTSQFNDYGASVSDAEIKDWLQWDIEQAYTGLGLRLVLINNEQTIVGSIGLHLEAKNSLSLGLELDEHCRGQGLMLEALQALLLACQQFPWQRQPEQIVATIHQDNRKAINLVEKLAFKLQSASDLHLIYHFALS